MTDYCVLVTIGAGFFSSITSKIAPPARAAAIKKLIEKLFEVSAKAPATAGPASWPRLKMKVM